ncbi:PREDICTED: peroxisomal acyl-coenzyme A oxidase 1-like [Amphimedon queenslandica]|uniref:Acyl-coenzyme A oxidase N-terminal domain-containing protein n=2 Tax=Amphimedon queenslandica TaxID=400682 RepID=A0AAN0JYV9_AMPQE|nr:PREDICTED: peroxisomal acyl-coenzyme A oxidase 1-like [Amphimedon queenslandica]XP_019862095.1 PREDICTED: peroxisomal acyl-coenzyme A oxidase 1-like [Amphimedon queenslandica]|eukprot:XP_019862094.1 PREDICTED: peroxisomal acyl-coenzyme A oxidase 1-like [Amphimedon queenslandica]
MFVPTIEGQGNEEQKEKWLKISRNFDIIGCYAQTELGHGTFIRGLETTATYDPSTKDIVMNSPTLNSMKWWPGSVGHTATHAIVDARLITKGKDEGIHLFIVQIEALRTTSHYQE